MWILTSSTDAVADLEQQLGAAFNTQRATDPQQVLASLRDGETHWLLAAPELVRPLVELAGREHAHDILDGIAQGVCVVDLQGNLLWGNEALHKYPAETSDHIRKAVTNLAGELEADHALITRRRTIHVDQKHYFDLTTSAVRDNEGHVRRAIGLVCDTTAISRMREKLDAIDAAGRELVALDVDATSHLDVPERLRLLEERLIRYCSELLEFNHFAVLVLDPKTNKLDTVLAGGFPEQAKAHDLYAEPEGNGICGYVAARGQSYICPDVGADPLYLSGYEAARSSLTVPLRLNERVVGVLNVEADEHDAFTEEDRQVAEIFGRYIAVALHMLKLLVVERSETVGQVAADVRAELSEPLNDIISEATRLLHHDDQSEETRRGLRAIIGYVDRAQEAVQLLTRPQQAIRGLAAVETTVDPALASKRVLIADDEDIIRETIADVMSKSGALPVMAKDGEEALRMINTQHFDLVLSDIKMPYRNGYEVFAAAKEHRAACPVILITGFGYDPEHSIVRASREGLAGVLFKPFKVEQLMELVHKALGTPAT